MWTAGDVGGTVVELGSRPFRVRAIDGRSSSLGLREVTATTAIELFVPGSRVGLDVVVLADCSGSMDVADLPDETERVGARWGTTTYRTRLEALKEALHHMLAARLRVAGRESRIALLRFNSSVQQRFPLGEGMVAVDSSAPPEVVDAFRDAVDGLYSHGGTDIPSALLMAAEVLDRHGRPDNDRLIVLVSDGRKWAPKTADATGELVFAADDPVSLVAHLHDRRKIRLHAIGISNDALFDAWVRRGNPDHPNLRPDHPLLTRLVEVGGGDPTRIGGIDVLEGYFSGLGAGLTRHVGRPAAGPGTRRLTATTATLLHQHTRRGSQDRCESAAARLRSAIHELNDYARLLALRQLNSYIPFDRTDQFDYILDKGELLLPVRSQYEFEVVLRRLHIIVVEQGPGRRTPENSTVPEPLAEIYDCFRPYVGRLNPLRQVYFHDKTGNSGPDQKDWERAVTAQRHYVGVAKIASDDAARWDELRTRLLEDAADVTEDAVAVARRRDVDLGAARAEPPPGEEQPPTGPADFSMQFDLRVRN
jgi:hypothetical protein